MLIVVIYFVYLISYMPCTRLRLQEQQAVFKCFIAFSRFIWPINLLKVKSPVFIKKITALYSYFNTHFLQHFKKHP